MTASDSIRKLLRYNAKAIKRVQNAHGIELMNNVPMISQMVKEDPSLCHVATNLFKRYQNRQDVSGKVVFGFGLALTALSVVVPPANVLVAGLVMDGIVIHKLFNQMGEVRSIGNAYVQDHPGRQYFINQQDALFMKGVVSTLMLGVGPLAGAALSKASKRMLHRVTTHFDELHKHSAKLGAKMSTKTFRSFPILDIIAVNRNSLKHYLKGNRKKVIEALEEFYPGKNFKTMFDADLIQEAHDTFFLFGRPLETRIKIPKFIQMVKEMEKHGPFYTVEKFPKTIPNKVIDKVIRDEIGVTTGFLRRFTRRAQKGKGVSYFVHHMAESRTIGTVVSTGVEKVSRTIFADK